MKLKRLLILLLGIVLAALALCGCASSAEPQEEVKLQKLSFNRTELVMGVGDTFQLELTLDPVDADKGRIITLYAVNSDKASVSETMLVTAKETGETEIVAASSYGGIEARVKVVIVPKLVTGMDMLVSLRGSGETIYMTNDLSIADEDLALISNERVLFKKPKTIAGGGYTLDLSGLTVADSSKGVIEVVTDEAFTIEDLTIVVPSEFKGNEDAAVYDPNGVLTMNNCSVVAK